MVANKFLSWREKKKVKLLGKRRNWASFFLPFLKMDVLLRGDRAQVEPDHLQTLKIKKRNHKYKFGKEEIVKLTWGS